MGLVSQNKEPGGDRENLTWPHLHETHWRPRSLGSSMASSAFDFGIMTFRKIAFSDL